MPITPSSKIQKGGTARAVSLAIFLLGILFASLMSSTAAVAQSASTPTTINISDTPTLTNARRLGVNLGTPTNFDSGQIMRQIMFTNPGFEGEHWQSVLHCKLVTATSCTDDDPWAIWPANFLQGATVQFIYGKATGTTATVVSSTVANSAAAGTGVTVNLSGLSVAPSVGDYLVALMEIPGNAQAGWFPSLSSGATISTEFNDLSPNTPGKQALRVTVPAGQTASISNYIEGFDNRSFLQMTGTYTLTFRAKSTGGSNNMNIGVLRLVNGAPVPKTYFNQTVALTTGWQDYSYTFSANDTGQSGAVQLQFLMQGASVLLDDVALTAPAASNNPTNYRNEVVNTLRKLNPGVLRYMDSGTNWGSTIDNMLLPDFAREPSGYSNDTTSSNQVAMGLNDFLQLCQAIGADPWYTMQTGMSVQDMSNLMDFLGGSTSTVYGAKRAALGQTAPWTSVFKTIHLEFGNEVWNTGNPGALMTDPAAYGQRAGTIFTAAKTSPSYSANSFDLILDGFQAATSWNQTVLANSWNYDTIDVASYLYSNFNDISSIENIYGPMFAEPEMQVTPATGIMNQQAVTAASAAAPAKLAVYESNLSAVAGSATQAAVNATIPSVGAGITASLNLLLAQRDLGVNLQNLFSLTGYEFNFGAATSTAAKTSPIWGSVIDMGGQTNLQRPNFISEQLANSAILPQLLSTSQTGANPTWNQPMSTNDSVVLPNAHYIQSFAYTDGTTLNVIAFNLSRTTALPITFAGMNAPTGAATISTLTSGSITDSNEAGDVVGITSTSQTLQAGGSITLPPYSMTVISAAAPYIPIEISAITATCARSALSPTYTTPCTSKVTGQGQYNAGTIWTVDQGTISSAGIYTAPSAVPTGGVAHVTATSAQDSTKTATFAISIAPDQVTGVTLSCGATSLVQTYTTNCTTTVAGTGSFSNAYTWAVSSGSITATGILTAPATGTSMTLTATSTQDPTKTATITFPLHTLLTITNPVVTTTSTSITVSWTTNLPVHNGIDYSAPGGPWLGTPYDNYAVTNPSYTITGLTPGTTYNMFLTSYTNSPNQTTEYNVVVTVPLTTPSTTVSGVAVSCAASSILQSGSTSCGATVAGTGSFAKTVNWSVSSGSITAGGVLAAPATGTAVTVTATSTQDSTKSGTFVISLAPIPGTITSVQMNCISGRTLFIANTTLCSGVAIGTGNYSPAVRFTTTAGTITSGGVLIAPVSPTTIYVDAISVQDPTKSAHFTITVTATIAISDPVIVKTSTSITAKWAVNVPAVNSLEYQTAGGSQSTASSATASLSPSYTLTGLTPGATYSLILSSSAGSKVAQIPITITLPKK